MHKIILILLLVYLAGCNTIVENNSNVTESDFNQAARAFSELKDALKNDNGRLWNYKLDGPVLLIDRETRIIIANRPDEKGELVNHGDYYTGKFPEQLNIANSVVDWNGERWTMVALPLPGTKEERLNLLIHESFHRVQPFIGFDSLHEIQNAHLDSRDGRIFLTLELEALKEALQSDNPGDHIQKALLFRQYRYQLFPGAKTSENSLEINEGLAEYTGSILSGRTKDELKKHYISEIDRFYNNPTYVRSFAYFTIPVYGYFMQQSDDKWNLKINKKTNLADFISGFFKVPPSKIDAQEIMRTGKSYHSDSIIKLEQNRELKRSAQIKKYKAQFLGDGTIKIGLENMQIGFNPGNLIPLDSFGTVYPNLRITDNWGILEVDSCGALMSPDWQYVTISSPVMVTDTLITGHGWKLKLNRDRRLVKENNNYRLIKK